MTAREPGLLALADQIHATAAEMLDDLIAGVRRDLARHAAEEDSPGEAFDVTQLGEAIRETCRGRRDNGLASLSTLLALSVYRLAGRDGRPVETRHPTGGVL